MSSFIYPKVRRDEAFVEELHGVKVADPYRWLEDPDSEETKAFVDAQDALTAEYIGSYQYRKNFHESLTEMYDFPRYGCPFKRGDFYYYFHNTGLQPQSILYQQTSLEAEPKVFFDPLTLEADGTAALRTHTFSKSGKYFAYGISRSGSDWTTVYVKPTSGPGSGPGEHSKDFVEWVKFSTLCFTHDDVGYFYNTLPKPENVGDKGTETNKNLNAKLCYHKLGTQQSEDILIYEDPENPEHLFSSVVSHDGRYILVEVTKDCDPVNKVWLIDLEKTNGKVTENLEFTKIFDNFDAEYDYIDNQGTLFYFKTNLNSPRYKIVRYDLAKPELGLIDLLPEHPVDVLYLGKVVNYDSLIVCYIHDVKHQLSLYQLSTGKFVKNVETLIGTLDSVAGRKEDTEFFVKFSGFLNPGVIYRYNFTDGSNSVFRETKVKGLNSDDLEVKQIFIESKDGTKVPIFIMSKKNIALDGNNPTIMYGYGGFSISIMPMFNSAWVTFVQHFNGILVVANIRGGAEYGEEWHKAGMLHNKQNVFDDFQAAAKWLINNKYTRPARLGITGGSNGGLLVGACINQTPQLFGAAVADVGVMDMLRFHKFTIGHAWKSDYGDPDKKEDFECLYKYSPLHNIQTKLPYPFVLLTTSDHDDRVVPLHSFKHIAQLQYLAKDNPNPLLIRIDKKAGHGMGKPTQKKIEEAVDKYTFIARALEVQWVD